MVGMVEVVAVVVAGVVVLGVVGVGVVMVMVRMVGSGGGRSGNDRRSGTTTTFPLLSLSRLEGSLCLEGASFQLGAHRCACFPHPCGISGPLLINLFAHNSDGRS